MNNYFAGCDSIESGKKAFREFAAKLHPDHGGNAEDFKAMMNDWEYFLNCFISGRFSAATAKQTEHTNMHVFQDVLNEIINFNMKIEINGFWIYAYDSFDYKEQLKDLGFWFSGKHKAWIFNGGAKKSKRRSNWTLNQIKDVYGTDSIRDEIVLDSIA